MTSDAPGFDEALLASVPARRMRRILVRAVPQLDFSESAEPSFLYTSGRPNRCNPRGVRALYFSEDERTTDAEFNSYWKGTSGQHQPNSPSRRE